MATRYCTSCGLDRREGERFCRNCGAPFDTGGTEPEDTPTDPIVRSAPAAVGAVRVGAGLPPAPGSPIFPPEPTARGASEAATPRPVGPGSTNLPFRPVALAGGVGLVIAALLPWVARLGVSATALDIPIEAVWDGNAEGGSAKLGFVLIALGALGGGFAVIPGTVWVRRLCGALALGAIFGFAVQVVRLIDAAGGSFANLFDVIGAGVYVALVGAIALIVSR